MDTDREPQRPAGTPITPRAQPPNSASSARAMANALRQLLEFDDRSTMRPYAAVDAWLVSAVSENTLRSWSSGESTRALIYRPKGLGFSFLNIIEAAIVAQMRRSRYSPSRIWQITEAIAVEHGFVDYPLLRALLAEEARIGAAAGKSRVSGRSARPRAYIRNTLGYYADAETGQLALQGVLESAQDVLRIEGTSVVIRSLATSRASGDQGLVSLSLDRHFGAPYYTESRAPVWPVLQALGGGASLEQVSEWHQLSVDELVHAAETVEYLH